MSIQNNTELLCKAAMNGNTKSVKRLIPLCDPSSGDNSAAFNQALASAATFGHIECVKLLIPVSQPEKSYALYWAAYYGNIKMVKLLLPVSDPLFKESLALQGATINGQKKCMDVLCPVSEISVALHALKTQYPDEPKKWQHLEEREIQRLKDVLEHETGNAKPIKPHRRKM